MPREHALVIWESGIRALRLSAEEIRRVAWRTPRARELAAIITGLMDSGLETNFATRLAPWGLAIRAQVVIAGHAVDALVGDRLVVQIDGFAHHSSSADRTRDLAHDRELIARGYTVLRFSYVEVVYRWDQVERAIARASPRDAIWPRDLRRRCTGFGRMRQIRMRTTRGTRIQ